MTPIRLTCLVPFCRHTRGQRKGEPPLTENEHPWICGKHWRHVSRQKKRHRTRILRLYDKAVASGRDGVAHHLHRRYWAVWGEIEKEAIEAAAGIA